jgi:hypothetical protein
MDFKKELITERTRLYISGVDECYIDEGIYVVDSTFSVRFGVTGKRAVKGDILKVYPASYNGAAHSMGGIKSNRIEKWDFITEEWKDWKSNWGSYRFSDVQDAFNNISDNISLVDKKESSKKVKELKKPSSLIFNSPKAAIKYLSTLSKRAKIKIEIQ